MPREKEFDKEKWKKLKRKIIRNTIIMILPSIVVAYVMVQNSNQNSDKNNLTGFENDRVNIATVTKEIKILFPEISKVEISIVESVNKKDEINEKRVICLTLTEKLSKDKEEKLKKWMQEIYDERCEIYQKTE